MRNGSTRAHRSRRERVLERDGWRCQLQLPGCLQTATHADHVIPLALGGADAEWNLQAACSRCNLSKGARPPGSLMTPRTPSPPMSSLSPRDTIRTRHVELPR